MKNLYNSKGLFSEYQQKKKKEVGLLKDPHLTYMTQRSFPAFGSPGERRAAVRLCLIDALVGAAVMTALLLFFDLFYHLSGNWVVYPLLLLGMAALFFALNWSRYRQQCERRKGGPDEH